MSRHHISNAVGGLLMGRMRVEAATLNGDVITMGGGNTLKHAHTVVQMGSVIPLHATILMDYVGAHVILAIIPFTK